MISAFNHYIDLIKNLGVSGGKLLDIGAATGFFMSIAKKRSFRVVGVELSDFAARKGRENGLDIVTGDLLNTNFEGESFDVITMFDVLEHVPDPKKLIQEVSRVLRPGGLIIINTPDAESLWARVLGKRWQLIMPPEHINYFSPKNLSKYLEDVGYEVKIDTKIGKKFTLQYILKMLYKWQGFRIFLVRSNKLLSSISIPINLRDNFFMIAKKK
jgi:2-polyprenyl-3-methyl-5-hydroxy-6-metoxy-1,4-benzoquinol methylase